MNRVKVVPAAWAAVGVGLGPFLRRPAAYVLVIGLVAAFVGAAFLQTSGEISGLEDWLHVSGALGEKAARRAERFALVATCVVSLLPSQRFMGLGLLAAALWHLVSVAAPGFPGFLLPGPASGCVLGVLLVFRSLPQASDVFHLLSRIVPFLVAADLGLWCLGQTVFPPGSVNFWSAWRASAEGGLWQWGLALAACAGLQGILVRCSSTWLAGVIPVILALLMILWVSYQIEADRIWLFSKFLPLVVLWFVSAVGGLWRRERDSNPR
jgi:hypothetical protein